MTSNPSLSSRYSNCNGWTEKRRRRRSSPQQLRRQAIKQQQQKQQQQKPLSDPDRVVISGMLPTLRALANLSPEPEVYQRGVCLIPEEESSDAANDLHTTLLEAYCREVGLRILRLPERALKKAFGREHQDLGCLLVLGGQDNFFLESPE